MRNALIATGALLAAMVAGCGDQTPEAGNAVTVPGPEAVENRLEDMPEERRNAVFIRAIRDAGQDCQHVESSQRSGEHQGFPVWTATCEGGTQWTIVIMNDGVAQILNPAEAQLVDENQATENAQDR